MLKVTVFDPLRPALPSNSQKIGEHGLIKISGGEAEWGKYLKEEGKEQIGTLLVIGN